MQQLWNEVVKTQLEVLKKMDQLLEKQGIITGNGSDETGTPVGGNDSTLGEDDEIDHTNSLTQPPQSPPLMLSSPPLLTPSSSPQPPLAPSLSRPLQQPPSDEGVPLKVSELESESKTTPQLPPPSPELSPPSPLLKAPPEPPAPPPPFLGFEKNNGATVLISGSTTQRGKKLKMAPPPPLPPSPQPPDPPPPLPAVKSKFVQATEHGRLHEITAPLKYISNDVILGHYVSGLKKEKLGLSIIFRSPQSLGQATEENKIYPLDNHASFSLLPIDTQSLVSFTTTTTTTSKLTVLSSLPSSHLSQPSPPPLVFTHNVWDGRRLISRRFSEAFRVFNNRNSTTILISLHTTIYSLSQTRPTHAQLLGTGFILPHLFKGQLPHTVHRRPRLILIVHLIHIYSKLGRFNDTTLLFSRMIPHGVLSRTCVIPSVVKSCSGIDDSRNVASGSALISGYAQQGYVTEAKRVSGRMGKIGIEPNLVSWNSLVTRLNQNGQYSEVVLMFHKKYGLNFKHDGTTISSVLPTVEDLDPTYTNTKPRSQSNMGSDMVEEWASQCQSIYHNRAILENKIIQIFEQEKGLEQFTATDGDDDSGGSIDRKLWGYFSMTGLDSDFLKSTEVRVKLIERYTREADVRNLGRNLIAILHATAVTIVETRHVNVLLNRTSTSFWGSRFGDGPNVIYSITGERKKTVKSSRSLEKLKRKGHIMIYKVEVIDEYFAWQLREFEGKKLVLVTKEGAETEETEGKQQKQKSIKKKFDGIFVSFLGSLRLCLHGWLLLVYLSFLPLHMNKITSVTYSLLHLEDKVKVWDAGIDKPLAFSVYQRRNHKA